MRALYISLLLIVSFSFISFGKASEADCRYTPDLLESTRIVVVSGSTIEDYVSKTYPNSIILGVNTLSDIYPILKSNSADFAIINLPPAVSFTNAFNDLTIVDSNLFAIDIAFAFNKKEENIRNEFDLFFEQFRHTETFHNMVTRWMIDCNGGVIPHIETPKKGATIRLGINSQSIPYALIANNEITGIEVELFKHFAANKGYQLEILDMNLTALLGALSVEIVDVAASGIGITKGRKEKFLFSKPHLKHVASVLVLNNEAAASNKKSNGFFKNIEDSFVTNIIHENRYKMIINGFRVTVIIAFFSILLGTLLGLFLCYFSFSNNKIARNLSTAYNTFIDGVPILVLLFINFYLIFAQLGISPMAIAIVTFAMNFSSYVSKMLYNAIMNVDRGQKNAGLALGLTRMQTLTYIVAPQALRQVLPIYKREIVSLVKSTSIVGFIAIQDITEVSNILRSRTFDAFFPLAITTILYFILAYLFTKLIDITTSKIIQKNNDYR